MSQPAAEPLDTRALREEAHGQESSPCQCFEETVKFITRSLQVPGEVTAGITHRTEGSGGRRL